MSSFVVYQLVRVIAVSKPRQQLLSVLMDSRLEVASNASVQNRVALVSQDIDAVDLFHTFCRPSLQRRSPAGPRLLRCARNDSPLVILRGATRRSNLGPRQALRINRATSD